MSTITSAAQVPVFERADPVKQHTDVAQNDQKREVSAAENKENIRVQQEQREQVKAPVNKGESTLVDKEV